MTDFQVSKKNDDVSTDKKSITDINSKNNVTGVSSGDDLKSKSFEEDKDEDLSAWEDEIEVVKSTKATGDKINVNVPNENKPPPVTIPVSQPAKGRRAGLVQEIMISVSFENDE